MMDRTNRQTVVGVFHQWDEAERAVNALRDAGFAEDQVGILSPGEDRGSEAAATDEDRGSHAGEGAAAGVVVGGLVGAAASLLIPGIGPVIAGGIIAGILGGAAVGAAAGGIIGALVGLGVPEHEAQYYEGEFKQGRTLVTVRSESRYTEASEILRRYGAYNIQEQEQNPEEINPSTMENAGTSAVEEEALPLDRNTSVGETGPGGARIPVVEEELVVSKHREKVGEVVLQRRVVSEQRTVEMSASHDEVQVERVVADRPATSAEPIYDGDTIRVPIIEERLFVEKRPWVVGELIITKKTIARSAPVTETVRRVELDVQSVGDISERRKAG